MLSASARLSRSLLAVFAVCASSGRSPGQGSFSEDCGSICEGLECDEHPYTCVLVDELYGCKCGTSSNRRLTSNSSFAFDCTKKCLNSCDPAEGPDCDKFANIGAKCSELEDDDLWKFNSDTCDCANSACENEDTIYEPGRDECHVWSSTSVSTEVELRDALLQSCQAITILADIHLSEGQLVISSKTRSRIVGDLNKESPRIIAAPSSRVILVEPSAWLEMKHVKVEDGVDVSLGGCVAVGASSTFIGDDVQVTNCTSGFLGGALIGWTGSRVELRGGSIVANSTSTYGGCAYVRKDATIRLNDDSLMDSCFAWEMGGAVAATTDGRVILDGSHIRRSAGHLTGGGGIGLFFGAHVDISNGSSIADCSGLGIGIGGSIAAWDGGTIVLTSGSTIKGSYAGNQGGAIFMFGDGTLLIMGGTSIVDTYAGVGCVYFNRGSSEIIEDSANVNIENTTIERCTTFNEEEAGALYTSGFVNLIAFALRDCSAVHHGACIFARNSVVNLEDSEMNGCTCSGRGCAFYASRSVVTVVKSHVANALSYSTLDEGDEKETLSGAAFYFGDNTQSFLSRVDVINAQSSMHSGGGMAITGGSVAHMDACKFINCSAGTWGGAVSIYGGVAHVTGESLFKSNVAKSGGAISVSGGSDSQLYASGSCWFTVVTLDWETSDAATKSQTGIWIAKKENQYLSDLTFDARGTLMWNRPTTGLKEEHVYCLAAGTYELWMAQANGLGWGGGSWDFATVAPGIELATDYIIAEKHLSADKHASIGATFSVTSKDSRGEICFDSNHALQGSGGAIYASEESVAYVHQSSFTTNIAAQNGGALCLGLLSFLEVSSCSFVGNSANFDGGALRLGHLSSSKVHDVHAFLNAAGRLGGFASFDRIQSAEVINATVRQNRASLGGGIAFDDCDYDRGLIINTLFDTNSALDTGGALWISESAVEVSTSSFLANSAEYGSGGAISVNPSEKLSFVLGETCTTVHIFVDWRYTTEYCDIHDPNNQVSYSCDSAANICARARTQGLLSCRGCRCPLDTAEGAENYVRVSGSTLKADLIVLPIPRALAAFEYCLSNGEFHISAHNTYGGGWYGGTVSVVVAGVRVVDGLKWGEGGFATSKQKFVVGDYSAHCSNFFDNEAQWGGGGGIYWIGSSPPKNVADVQAVNNSADYGDFQAGPAIAIAILKDGTLYTDASNATLYSAASGHPLTDQLVVHLLDESNQLVTSEVGRTAIVRAVGADDASVSNNLAEFIDGVATFTNLFVTHMPNVTLNAVVESDISTLRVAELPLVFDFRACYQNEYEDEKVCKVCEAGMYLNTEGICKTCFHGIDCTEPGRRLEALTNVRGFWRPSRRATEVYRCPYANACPTTTSVGADACEGEGHIGPLCSVCKTGFYENYKHRCLKCGQDSATVAVAFLCVVWVVLGVAICLLFTKRGSRFLRSFVPSQAATNDRTTTRDDERSGSYIVKLKVTMTFGQIITNMTYIFSNLRFPTTYAVGARFVGQILNLAFLGGFPARCFSSSSPSHFYVKGLLAKTLSPICLAVLFCIIAVIKSKLEPQYASQHWHLSFEAILLMLHFVLSTTSTAGFRAFVCDSYKSEDGHLHYFLRVEPTISCTSQLWRRFVAPYGALCILIYAIGVPSLYAILLYTHREQLSAKHHNDEIQLDGVGASSKRLMSHSVRRTIELSPAHQRKLDKLRRDEIRSNKGQQVMLFRFLWLDYSCRCYYFEVVEAVRRILLTAGISVISPGSATQINCGYVVATFFAVVYISFKPFVNKADNVLAITAQLATAVTLYVILLLKIELVGYLAANIFLISLAALPFSIALLTVRHTLSNSASPSKTKPVSDDVATSEMNLNSKSETTIKHFPDSESDEPINDDETTTCEVAVGQEPGALGVEIDTVTSEDRAS